MALPCRFLANPRASPNGQTDPLSLNWVKRRQTGESLDGKGNGMNANGHLIETLANSKMFKDYEHAYSEAVGLPLTLRPLETWQLPLHGKRHENCFCKLMAGTSRTCASCLRTQERLVQSARTTASTVTCSYGLAETAVPVKLGSDTVGFVQTGQVLPQRPTLASFTRVVDQGHALGVNLDTDQAREAYFKTPVVPAKRMESISVLLSIFADHLAMKSNQIAVHSAHAEPPVITKAKEFIEEHHTEDLSLGQVAKAVHTSIFHFCKLFKKITGINFTEYVARLRTEKAKNLLLNPNLRVSEIAYAVGFQSLTHFNRIFKKLVGESPTDYRRRLPTSL